MQHHQGRLSNEEFKLSCLIISKGEKMTERERQKNTEHVIVKLNNAWGLC